MALCRANKVGGFLAAGVALALGLLWATSAGGQAEGMSVVRVFQRAGYETVYYGVVRVDGERAILRMRRYTLADGTRVYRDVTLPGTYGELEARALAYGLERLAFAEGKDVLGQLPMPAPD